jgi:hypothetical protein
MTAQQKQKFIKLVKSLNSLLEEVRKVTPNANYYLAEDTLNILSGESHEGKFGLIKRQDRIMIGECLVHSGGGDW